MSLGLLAAALLSGCQVTDGDTIRCGDERIRLLGIDAPEKGACPANRVCAPGDPRASAQSLEPFVVGREVSVERVGQDRYGRTLALVASGGVDLSCLQLRSGNAIYRRDWDNGDRLRARCPSAR